MKKLNSIRSEHFLTHYKNGHQNERFNDPPIRIILFLVIFWLGYSPSVTGQSNIITDGSWHSINNPGSIKDLTIPDNPQIYEIKFTLYGGDGGKATVYDGPVFTANGGQGAMTEVSFPVGDGTNEIPRGSVLRFMEGVRGSSSNFGAVLGAGFAYSGGGGGSAVFIKKPGSSSWILLAVAGGGGGAYQGMVAWNSVDHNPGQGGRSSQNGGNGSGTDLGSGGANGQGGSANVLLSGGGGGMNSDGHGAACTGISASVGGGQSGQNFVGSGGHSGSCVDFLNPMNGGAGYGGGGAGLGAGGGGGGYSGGGGGGATGRGGGGGSYITNSFTKNSTSISEGGNTANPQNGGIQYQTRMNQLPVAQCKTKTLYLNASGSATLEVSDIDNGSYDPDGSIASRTISQSVFSCADVGDQDVELTVTDDLGAQATCTATVTVLDEIPPTFDPVNITVYLDANGQAIITADDVITNAADACGIASKQVSQANFDCSNVGTNTVTITVTDNNNNKTIKSATVTVLDEIPPTFDPVNITVYLDANGQAIITADDVITNAADACGIASKQVSQTNFDCSNVGTNTVTITVTDDNSNETIKSATVTVLDEIPPTFDPVNITVYLDASGQAIITADDVITNAADACGIASKQVSQTNFDCSNVGTNTVTITMTDNNNNETEKSATVTVINDLLPIVRTQNVSLYLDQWGRASVSADMLDAGSTANCGIASMWVEGQTQFGCEDLGENIVALTAMGQNGKTASRMAVVTVKKYTPDFSNIYGISDGDTITWPSCQSPLDFSTTDLKDHKEMKKHGIVIATRSKITLPENTPWSAYEMWRYRCEYTDPCGNKESLKFLLIMYDVDPPLINRFPSDTTISSTADLPEPDKGVKLVDFCQYVVWDTVTTTPLIDLNTGDTLGFTRRWIAEDPSGHRSFRDQMIWIGKGNRNHFGNISGRIASEDQWLAAEFPGEPGLNGIPVQLYHLDTLTGTRENVQTWMTGDWNGTQGRYYFNIQQAGTYQVRIDSSLCLTDTLTFDKEQWSDTLALEPGMNIDLGLVLTEACRPEPAEVDSTIVDTLQFPEPELDITNTTDEDSWTIYPNPASGYISIRINTDRILNYRLYDALGRFMKSGNYTRGESLDLSDIKAGVYYLQLNEAQEQRGTKRLIILE